MRQYHHSIPDRLLALSLMICILYGLFTFPGSVSLASNPGIPADDILLQENFEDGDITIADPNLHNGMTWTSHGSIGIGTVKGYEGNVFKMDAGAYILSDQAVNEPTYTVSFTILNWYNTAARVMIAYQDESNYYSFSPVTGQLWRTMDGVEEELINPVRSLLGSPRQNPSINHYKIYFYNDGSSVTISVDRDGYENRKDYEFTTVDLNAKAVNLFKGGKIKLARVDTGSNHFWVSYDNILVTKGKLQMAIPRNPGKLYVSQSKGDDNFEGTENNPFKTINKAIASSYPGDEIIVDDGVYEEQISFLSDRVYGEEGKRLTIRARNRQKATIPGANLKYGDYVTLDGFEVVGAPIVVGGSTGSEVLNNYIHDIEKRAGIEANGVNSRVAGNYIYKTNKGINVSGANMLVENNEIERLIDTGADADYFRFFGEGHIIRGNYMHGTRHEEIGKSHVDGFQTFDNNGEFARHIIIEGNFIEDFYHQGFMGEGSHYYHSYDITFRNNIFKDAAAWGLCITTLRDVKVYNNLFINMNTHGVGFSDGTDKPATGEVRNNIFYDAKNCYFGLDTAKYGSNNLIFSSDPYKKYAQDSFPNDFVNVDPLFMDMENNDFSVHPNSPAIDQGISLDFNRDFAGNARPYGNGWDIGPYEAQESSLPVAYIEFSNIVNSTTGYEPFKVVFDGSRSYTPNGGSIVSYEWDFGDGSTGSGVQTYHSFSAGNHIVKLTVTDNNGKKHTAQRKFNTLASQYPNLYLYLPFEGSCVDMSGKGQSITAGENTILENSAYGKSVRFNNDNSRSVSVAHSNYLDGLDTITIAFFAKKDSVSEAETVIHKHIVYKIALTADGFGGYIYTDGKQKAFNVKNVVKDTNWHHYAITYDGANIVMYLDGKECSRLACSGKISRDASRAVVIGRDPWGDSFEGLMDEVRIYDRALSEDEIGQIMNGSLIIPSDDKTLTGITAPKAITGVSNGTAKTAGALGLPGQVMLTTDNGNVPANVLWDVGACTYDPGKKEAQTFTINGTVTLPSDVVNPNKIPLTVNIQVTVNQAAASPTPTSTPTPTVSPSPTQGPSPTQSPSPTPTQDPGSNPPTSGPSGGSTPAPTMKPTPSVTPEPTRTPIQDQETTEDLITSDYPEMVTLLELLYEKANIRDNTLNPTYGFMMKREPVITLTSGYQNNLRDLAKLTFRDVRGDEWYASHIPLAVYRKFVKGFPDGTFKGNNLVTRAEVLTMLARFNNSEASEDFQHLPQTTGIGFFQFGKGLTNTLVTAGNVGQSLH